jgi:hypothetical protein
MKESLKRISIANGNIRQYMTEAGIDPTRSSNKRPFANAISN